MHRIRFRGTHNILGDLNFVAVNIDDICVASASEDQDRQHLKIVFDLLRQANLRMFETFLGHSITAHGISQTVERVSAINEFRSLPEHAN